MSMLFRVRDPRGITITCSEGTWTKHICAHHPDTKAWEAYVRQTIREPDFICADTTNPDVETYYLYDVLPGKYRRIYLKVVVEFSTRRGQRIGRVLTAFPAKNMKTGEDLLWTGKRDV